MVTIQLIRDGLDNALAPRLCLGAHDREALLPESTEDQLELRYWFGKQSFQDLRPQAEPGSEEEK